MGNDESRPECGFSNATNYDVKFSLHSDKKVIKQSELEIGGGVGGSYAGFGVDVKGNYAHREEAEYKLVDPQFEGFATVNKGTRLGLKGDSSGSHGYISIALILPGDKLKVHTLNHAVNADSCNFMLGTNIHGDHELVKLHKNRTWRAHGGNGTQNYYGNRVCNGCGQQRACKRGCSDLAEFGGHKE